MLEDGVVTAAEQSAPSEIVPAGRRQQIMAYVTETGPVSVRALSGRFQVSSDTIRRDLDQLAAEGLLVRTHGGAMGLSAAAPRDGGRAFDTALTPAKREVGALAARLVTDDSVIMVNAGATAVAMARELKGRRDLTIVTNNLLIPPAIPPESCRFMYVLGGEVRLVGQSTTGPVENQLSGSGLSIRCDLALISVGGVTAERGYSTGDLPEALMMHEMMTRAAKVAVLADSSKFGRQLFANVAHLGEADYFVTDTMPPIDLRERLLESGVEILTPDSDLP